MSSSETEDEDLSAPLKIARARSTLIEPRAHSSDTEDEDLGVSRAPKAAKQLISNHIESCAKVIAKRNGPTVQAHGFETKSDPNELNATPLAERKDTSTSDQLNYQVYSKEDSPSSDSDILISDRQASLSVATSKIGASEDESISDRGSKDTQKPFFHGKPINPKRDILLGLKDDKTVLPGCTAQWLRPYQIDGILFLYDLYTTRTGGILGDDMGLGKTVQVIGFLNAVFGKDGTEKDWKRMREKRAMGEEYPVVMILCPGTLIDNWLKELETWSWTHIVKFHGPDKESALKTISSGRAEVLITTYNTYKTNEQQLNQIRWSVVIADECHIIKEKKSQITQSANLLNSDCRIGLTGTAIQNNYDELYTLLNWTNPGAFGSSTSWHHSVSMILKNGQKHTATNYELNLARNKAIELSRNLLPRVLLRRTKALIAHQLPKKTDKVVFCPLTPLQITAYDNLMMQDDVCFLRDAKKLCPCGSRQIRQLCCYAESPSGKTFAEMLFPYLHYLRNLSNHMALCLPRAEDAAWKRARAQELLEEALPSDWRALVLRPPMQNGCDAELCGKWKILQKLLVHWKREGSKVLIFSSSVKLLDMLNDLMMQEHYLYEYLHGSMSLEARANAVHNFNTSSEQFVFLISTRAGGVGLNIVSANKVVIFDPNWNPAHDLQAQDRAYRIGQSRDVEVYRLISTGTVEEVVYARQVYKQQQANIGYDASEERRYFRGVQGDAGQRGELFGVENLLTFHGENHVLKAIFDDTEEAESHFDNIRTANIDISATQEDIQNADTKDEFGINSLVKEEFPSGPEESSGPSNEDVISQILANAGVSYSHKNNEVVGGSKIEAEISKLAARAAKDVKHQNRDAYLATLLKAQNRHGRPLTVDEKKGSVESSKRIFLAAHSSDTTVCKPTTETASTKRKARALPWMSGGGVTKKEKRT